MYVFELPNRFADVGFDGATVQYVVDVVRYWLLNEVAMLAS